MRVKAFLVFLVTIVFSQIAVGGAWDMGPFENDDALDWVRELEESTDFSAIKAALRPATSSGSYIEAPSGSYAIAAAEVVAALLGNPAENLPSEISTWVAGQEVKPGSDLIGWAKTAVTNVLSKEKSELSQLWSEAGPSYDEWRDGLTDLLQRLD